MKMERRWSARKPINLNVALYYDRLGLLPCTTRDMSLEGMFVHTGRIMLSQHVSVDAVLTANDSLQGQQIRLPARVVRVSDEGAGLRFRNFDIDTFRFLREILAAR